MITRQTALVVGAVLIVAGCTSDGSPDSADPGRRPTVAGDVAIEVDRLRFPEPLDSDVVAFVDDPETLPPPRQETREEPPGVLSPGSGGSHSAPGSVGFVATDGPLLMMTGAVVDLDPRAETAVFDGPPVEVGVDDARHVDAERGAVAMPLADGWRIVGPRDYFSFGGGGPFVDDEDLLTITRRIGTVPLATVDELPGLTAYVGTIDGVTVDPLGMGDALVMQQGDALTAPRTSLLRLAEAPTALELIGYAKALTGGLRAVPEVGDVSFVGTRSVYVELVSPVDLLLLSQAGETGLDSAIATIDLAPLDELADAFDGAVGAPRRGTG